MMQGEKQKQVFHIKTQQQQTPTGMLSDSVFAPWSLPFTITVQILSKYDFQVNAKKNSTLHQKYSDRGKNPGNCSAA